MVQPCCKILIFDKFPTWAISRSTLARKVGLIEATEFNGTKQQAAKVVILG